MTSRRRKPKRWPILILAVAAIGLLLWLRPWAGDGGQEPDQNPDMMAVTANPDGSGDVPPQRMFNPGNHTDRNSSDKPDRSLTFDRNGTEDTREPSREFEDDPRLSHRIDSGWLPSNLGTSEAFEQGREFITDERFVEGRAVLSQLLFDSSTRISSADSQAIRDMLTSINKELVFGKDVYPNDPVAEYYLVQSGDLLSRIAPQYKVPYQFLEQINQIDARRLQAGKPIKVVKGPFHVRVIKRDYRMDVFLRAPDGSPVYVCSYPVGLGEDDSTPIGLWRVTPGRKVINPDWRNPRTGEYFRADDPRNPIGEYWIALEGIDDRTRGVPGYGIHGTVDPESIGEQASMGCIRLSDQDIQQIFMMLVGSDSTIEIVP